MNTRLDAEAQTPVTQPAKRAGAASQRSPTLLLVLLVFIASLAADLRVLPGDNAAGQDFNDFYVATVAQQRAQNPYDGRILTGIEQALFGHSSFSNTVASPPAFFVAFRPLTLFGPRTGFILWLLVSCAVLILAVLTLCKTLELPPSLLLWMLALSPPVVITLFLGQTSILLLGLYVLAIRSLLRGQPWLAGVLLAVTLVKPHVMIVPVALLCGLSWKRGGRDAALATVLATLAIFLAALPFAGLRSTADWLHALLNYGSTFDHWQPDISSLAGIYLPFVSQPVGRALSAIALCGGLINTAAILAHASRTRAGIGTARWWQLLALGIAVWLSVLPYEHPYDAVLLILPLAVLLRAAWPAPVRGLSQLAVVCMLSLPELDLMGFRPNLTFSYTVIPILVAAVALFHHVRHHPDEL